MRVAYLANVPEACPLLAAAFKAEWSAHSADRTAGVIAADFRACLHTDRLPLALVASDGEGVCGTLTLRQDSLTTHPHLTPWVAAFYVTPHRSARLRGSAPAACTPAPAGRRPCSSAGVGPRWRRSSTTASRGPSSAGSCHKAAAPAGKGKAVAGAAPCRRPRKGKP